MADGSVMPHYRPRQEVRECRSTACALHPYREGHRAPEASVPPLAALRAMCWECIAGRTDSVKWDGRTITRKRPDKLIAGCVKGDCALYAFVPGRETCAKS